MKLIVGLGNPGKEYEATRHNVGFWALDVLAEKLDVSGQFQAEKKFNCETAEAKISDERTILVKPQTFMNRSGEAVSKISDFFKIAASDIIVLCDDTYLELGQSRIRFAGQSGGHNGLESVIAVIGADFWRVRFGIGEQGNLALEDFVLQKMSPKDRKIVDGIIDTTVQNMVDLIAKEKLENKSYQIN